MDLYEKIRNAECEIPEAFDMRVMQMIDIVQHSRDDYELVCMAFKFGYMQRCRAEQISKTNKADGNRTESEAERLRRYIYDMVSQIGSERRLRQIYTVVHNLFINERREVLNERKNQNII